MAKKNKRKYRIIFIFDFSRQKNTPVFCILGHSSPYLLLLLTFYFAEIKILIMKHLVGGGLIFSGSQVPTK